MKRVRGLQPTVWIVSLANVAALAHWSGCGPVRMKGADVAPSAPGEAAAGEGAGAAERDDPFAPVELRIHPLTRVLRTETPGQAVIEAHFELLDTWGHTTKALGRLEVELTTAGDGGDRGVRWTVDLTDPEENSTQRFDDATRTYRLRLVDAPADLAGASNAELRAAFVALGGARLSAARRLNRPGL